MSLSSTRKKKPPKNVKELIIDTPKSLISAKIISTYINNPFKFVRSKQANIFKRGLRLRKQ